jgi:hypothetical protein
VMLLSVLSVLSEDCSAAYMEARPPELLPCAEGGGPGGGGGGPALCEEEDVASPEGFPFVWNSLANIASFWACEVELLETPRLETEDIFLPFWTRSPTGRGRDQAASSGFTGDQFSVSRALSTACNSM